MNEKTINLGGKEIPVYSYEHLSYENPYAKEEKRDLLLKEIDSILNNNRETEWGQKFIKTFQIAKDFINNNPDEIENYENKKKFLIYEGNMFGLGAAWGVSKEAYLLWASVAISMKKENNFTHKP
jgi:hypothetical protein